MTMAEGAPWPDVGDDDAELAVGKREHVVIIAAGVEAGAVVGGKVAPIPLGSAAGRMRRIAPALAARAPADRGCAALRARAAGAPRGWRPWRSPPRAESAW